MDKIIVLFSAQYISIKEYNQTSRCTVFGFRETCVAQKGLRLRVRLRIKDYKLRLRLRLRIRLRLRKRLRLRLRFKFKVKV